MIKDTPLIWTNKGNLPVENLEYSSQWFETDDHIKLVETYILEGEVVKQNVHLRIKECPAKIATNPEKNKIEEAFAAGYTIAEYAGYNILKKNGRYCGIVNESKMVLANDTYDSISELIDALGSK